MDRPELADFLRRSRERLRPQEVGLPGGPRRRTPGLRREEVAQLAGISADYLMRMEQKRGPQPSTQVLAALARALRLTEDERDHLYILAGHRPPAGRLAGNHVRHGLLHLLDQLTTTPAQILTDLGDLLAQNAMAQALFGIVCSVRRPRCRRRRGRTAAEHGRARGRRDEQARDPRAGSRVDHPRSLRHAAAPERLPRDSLVLAS